MNSTVFVLFDKYCSTVDQLGSKNSSRDFQLNCIISYFFIYIYYFIHGSKSGCDGDKKKALVAFSTAGRRGRPFALSPNTVAAVRVHSAEPSFFLTE
jgi:hypothetical protein